MAIDPTGGERDAALATRRRMLEQSREKELDRVEQSYSQQVKEREQSRAAEIIKARQAQADEIARIQSDVDHKVTLASQAADDRLRQLQSETLRVTDEASRNFRQRAQALAQTQKELQEQRNHLLAAHADSMKKLNDDNEFMRTEIKNRYSAQADQAVAQGENQIKSLNQKQQADISKTREDFATQKRMAEAQGRAEYYRLKDQQQRLQDELKKEEVVINDRERSRIESLKKNYADQAFSERIKGETEVEKIRQTNQSQIRALQEKGQRNLEALRENIDHDLGFTQKDAEQKIANTRSVASTNLMHIEKDYETKKRVLEREYAKKLADRQAIQEANEKEMESRTTGLRQKANEQYLQQALEIREKRQQVIQNLEQSLQADVQRTMNEAQKQIEQTKNETTEKMAGTLSKSQDPFYRIRDLNASLVEREDGIMILIEAPEHEQNSIRVTQNNKGFTITGNRRFESRSQTPLGHTVSTNSYQSYSETVPLAYKVDTAKLVRSYDSGVLKIFLPRA